MTVKQEQCLLAYLGYYTGQIDGQWGGMSTAACRAFQKDYGLTADGICGAMTQKMLVAAVAGTAVKVERPAEAEQAQAMNIILSATSSASTFFMIPPMVSALWSRSPHAAWR